MCDQQSLRSACAYTQSDQSLCLSLEYFMTVKLLTEHHLEFLSLKGGCTGLSESTLVKTSNCWKSHVTAQMYYHRETIISKPTDNKISCTRVTLDIRTPKHKSHALYSILVSQRVHLLACRNEPRQGNPVFGVSDNENFKPVSSVTETS